MTVTFIISGENGRGSEGTQRAVDREIVHV